MLGDFLGRRPSCGGELPFVRSKTDPRDSCSGAITELIVKLLSTNWFRCRAYLLRVPLKFAHGGASFCSPAPPPQRPSRLVVLPCRRWATRSAIAAHGPSPGRAALAPRRRARPSSLPAGRRPESPHLRARCSGGADLERARGGRRGAGFVRRGGGCGRVT